MVYSNRKCKFGFLAPWRVLGIDKCGALTRAAAKHTPRKRNKKTTGKPNRKRRGAEGAGAEGKI